MRCAYYFPFEISATKVGKPEVTRKLQRHKFQILTPFDVFFLKQGRDTFSFLKKKHRAWTPPPGIHYYIDQIIYMPLQ